MQAFNKWLYWVKELQLRIHIANISQITKTNSQASFFYFTFTQVSYSYLLFDSLNKIHCWYLIFLFKDSFNSLVYCFSGFWVYGFDLLITREEIVCKKYVNERFTYIFIKLIGIFGYHWNDSFNRLVCLTSKLFWLGVY